MISQPLRHMKCVGRGRVASSTLTTDEDAAVVVALVVVDVDVACVCAGKTSIFRYTDAVCLIPLRKICANSRRLEV